MSDTIAQRLAPILSGQTTGLDAARQIQALEGTQRDALRSYIQSQAFTPEQLSRLSPNGIGAGNLSFAQNRQVLRQQAGQLVDGGIHKAPGRILSGAYRATLGSGGFGAAGAGLRGRYIPFGARLGMASMLAPEAVGAARDIDPTGQGRSKLERVGGVAGGLVGNIVGSLPPSVTARLGFGGGVAASMLAGTGGQLLGKYLGGAAGRLADKGISAVRGVNAGDATMQTPAPTIAPRQAGSNAL